MSDDLESKLLPSTPAQISALEQKSQAISPLRATLDITKEDASKVYSSIKNGAVYCAKGALTVGKHIVMSPYHLAKFSQNSLIPAIRSITKEDVKEISSEVTKGFFAGMLPGKIQEKYFKEKATDYTATNALIELGAGIVMFPTSLLILINRPGIDLISVSIAVVMLLEGGHRLGNSDGQCNPSAPAIVALPYHTARLLAKPFVSYAISFSARYNDKVNCLKTKDENAIDYTTPQLPKGEPHE